MKNRRMVLHSAWQAAHELLADPEMWFATVIEGRGGYTDAQVATAMRCMGFADDLVVRYEGVRVAGYELPATWIPVDENNTLDVYPRLLETVQGIFDLPTLDDALADMPGFAAGFELTSEGMHPLPEHVAAIARNGAVGL